MGQNSTEVVYGFGQLGSAYTDLAKPIVPPQGMVIVAITFLADNTPTVLTPEKLEKVHSVVYGKPYDIVIKDWIQALTKHDTDPQKTSRFWCSALIGYIYTKCGILKEDTDWTILRPSDFALSSEHLNFINGSYLANVEIKIQ